MTPLRFHQAAINNWLVVMSPAVLAGDDPEQTALRTISASTCGEVGPDTGFAIRLREAIRVRASR